jgi:hypothetical protein
VKIAPPRCSGDWTNRSTKERSKLEARQRPRRSAKLDAGRVRPGTAVSASLPTRPTSRRLDVDLRRSDDAAQRSVDVAALSNDDARAPCGAASPSHAAALSTRGARWPTDGAALSTRARHPRLAPQARRLAPRPGRLAASNDRLGATDRRSRLCKPPAPRRSPTTKSPKEREQLLSTDSHVPNRRGRWALCPSHPPYLSRVQNVTFSHFGTSDRDAGPFVPKVVVVSFGHMPCPARGVRGPVNRAA